MKSAAGRISGKRTRNILIAVIGLIAVAAVFTVIFSSRLVTVMQASSSEGTRSDTAAYFVVVAGKWADRAIVEQVFHGVESLSDVMNCAVELCAPDTAAQDVPVSQLLEYASFACADGVILVNSDESLSLPLLTDVHGSAIPIITVGQWSASNTEISCISSNYYSMGKEVVRSLLQKDVSSLLIFSDAAHAHQGLNSLASSVQESFNSLHMPLSIEISIVDTPSAFVSDDLLRRKIMETDAEVVLCVTPELTAQAAQTLIDTNRTGDLKVLGLYQTDRTLEYMQKGLVTALISPNTEVMGQYAIEEMASYLTTGYCNSYRRGNMLLLDRSHAQ